MTDQTSQTSTDLLLATSLMTSFNSDTTFSAITQCSTTALIDTSSHSQIENPSKPHQSVQCQIKLPPLNTSDDSEQTENSFTKCINKQDFKINEKKAPQTSEQIECQNENFAKNQDEFSQKVNETLLDPSCNLSTKIKKEVSFSGNLGNLAIKSSTNYGDLNTTANNLLPSNSAFVNNALVSIDHEPMDKVTKKENHFKITNDENVKIKKKIPTKEKLVDYQTSSDKYTEILMHSPKDQKILPQLLQQKGSLTIHQKLSACQNSTDEQPLDLTIPYKRTPSPVCTVNKQENSTEHPLDLSFKKQNNFIKKVDPTNISIRNPYERYKIYQNLMMHQKRMNNQLQDDNVNSFISKLQQQLPQFHQRSFTLEQRRLNDSQPLRAFLQKPSQKSSMGDINNPICVDDFDNLNIEPTKRLVTNLLKQSTNKGPVHENQAKNTNADNQSVILASNGNNFSFESLSRENQFQNSLSNCFTNPNLNFYDKNSDDKHARYNQSNKTTSNKISFQNSFFITESQNLVKRNNLANDININNDIPNNGAFANAKNNEAKIFDNEKFCIDDRLNAHKNHYQLSSFDKNSSNHINNKNHDSCNLAFYLRQQNTHPFNYSGNFPLSTSFIQNSDVAMNTNSSNIFSSSLIKPHSTNNPPNQMNTAMSTQSQLSAFINFSKNVSYSSTYPSSITLITSSKCTITTNSSNGGLISTNITNFSNCTVINNYSPNVQNSSISKNVNPNCANLADIKNGTFNPNFVNNLTFSLNNLINNTNPYNVKFPNGRNSKVIPVANVQPFMKNRFNSNQTVEPIIINPSPSPPYSNHNQAFQQNSFNNLKIFNPVTKSSNCHTSNSSDTTLSLFPSQTGVFHSPNNIPKSNKDAVSDGKFNRTFFQPSNLTVSTNQTTTNLKNSSSGKCNNENHIDKLPSKDHTADRTISTKTSMQNKNARSGDNNGLDFNNNNTKDVDKSSHAFNKKISSRPNETKSKRKQNSSIEYIDDDDDTAESITESRKINSNENVSEFKDTPNKTNNKIQANISLKSNSKNSGKKVNKKNIKTGFGANNSVNNKNDINERDAKNNSLNSSFAQIETTSNTFASSHDSLFISTSNTSFSNNAKTDSQNRDNQNTRLHDNDFPIESKVVIKKENCSKENTSFCLAHDFDANENTLPSLLLSASQNSCSEFLLTSSTSTNDLNKQPNNLHENIKEERKEIYEKSCMNSEHPKGNDNQSENHSKFNIESIHNQVHNLSTLNLTKPHLSDMYSTETQKQLLNDFCNYRPESSFHQFPYNQSHGGTSSIFEENSDQKNVKNAPKRSSKGKAIMKKSQWRCREMVENSGPSHSLPSYHHADQHRFCVDASIHPSHKQNFHPTLKLPFFSNKTLPCFQNYELKNEKVAQNEARNAYSIERNENLSWLNNFNQNSVDCINSEAHSLEANNINLSSLSKTKNTNSTKKSSINNGNSVNKGNNDKNNIDNFKNNQNIKSQVGFYVSAFRNSNKGKHRKNIQSFPQSFPLSNPKKLGETKLHIAVKSESHTLVLKYLKEINCNAQDNLGNTPLHVSTRLNNWQLSVILLAHGALPNAKALDGTRPMNNAIRHNSFSLVHLLLSYGADMTLVELQVNKLGDKTTSKKMKLYFEGLLSELKGAPIEGFLWGFPRLDLESGLLSDLPADDTQPMSSSVVFDVFSSSTLASPAVFVVCTKQQSKPLLCHLFTDVCKFLSTSQKAFLNKHLHNKYKTTYEKNIEKPADNISPQHNIDFEFIQDRIVILDSAQISTVEKLFEDPNLNSTNSCVSSSALSNNVVPSNTNSTNLKQDSKTTRQCPKSSSFVTSSLQKYILINEKLKSMMKIHVMNTNSETIPEDDRTDSVSMSCSNSYESDKAEGLEKTDEKKDLIASSTSFSADIDVSAMSDNSTNTSYSVHKTPTTLPSKSTDATYSAKTLDNEANSFTASAKNLKRKSSSTENMVIKSVKSSTRSQNNNVFEGLTKLAKICKSTVPLVKNIGNKNKNLFGSTSKDFIKSKTNSINDNSKEETNGVKKRGNAKKIENSGLSKSKKCEVVNDVVENKDCKTSKRRI